MKFRLHAASCEVRRRCGWHITPNIELSGSLNTTGGMVVQLPARHVTEIVELTDKQGKPLSYSYDVASGLVELSNAPYPRGIGAIRYRIRAGYRIEDVQDVQAVVVSIARRAALSPYGLVRQQSVNGASVSYSTPVMSDEIAKLQPYTIRGLP